MSKEDARSFIIEKNVVTRDNILLRKLALKVAFADNSLVEHMTAIKHFNVEFGKKKKVKDILNRIKHSKYVDVHHRIFSLDPIMNVKCSKPKGERIFTMHLIRRDYIGEYPKKIHVLDLVKYGYWWLSRPTK